MLLLALRRVRVELSAGCQNFRFRIAKIEIAGFMLRAVRQINQIRRRVVLGETIALAEMVFLIFEPHAERVCKGKAGVPVESGVKVCILEDHHQFILRHQVMEKKSDDQVTVPPA